MTLLDDIRAIDLSSIVDAKLSVRAAVDTDQLRALVADGPARQVLGDLGAALAGATEGLGDPAALLGPLVEGLGRVPGLLGLDGLPVADYLGAVQQGAEILALVVGGLSGDLSSLAPTSGTSLGDVLERAGGPVGELASQAIATLGRYRALIDTVEAGVPSDPAALADLALDILLPFPRAALGQVRGQLDAALGGLASVGTSVPSVTTTGLVAALVEVRARAEAADGPGVQAALARLARLGDEAVASLAGGLRTAAQAVGALRLDVTLPAMAKVSGALRAVERGALEELADWRARIAEVRSIVGSIDPAAGMALAGQVLDLAEGEARRILGGGVDTQLERLKAWLRGLLREIPLRDLRARLTSAILGAAQAVTGADLDRVATAIRERIAGLSDLLAGADLGELVGAATEQVEAAVRDALDQVEAALGTITGQVNALAGQAQAVLERAVGGLEAFKVIVDEVTTSLDPSAIDRATQQAVAALTALREQVETVVSAAPLPDQLRPVIDQLVGAVSSFDLEAVVGDPLRDALAQVQLPGSVGATVTAGLESVAGAVSALVPTQLVAELGAELDHVLAAVGDLDLAPLTAGLSGVIDEAASFLEGVDVVGAVAPASEAFAQVLAAVDRAHPRRLLAPAIEAYDRVLGNLPVPDGGTIARRAAQVTAVAGEATARIATQPLQKAAPSGASLAPARGAAVAGPGDAPPGGVAPPPVGMRPGDIVRMVGFLPAALRDGLASLGAGPAGATLAAVDRLCAGLAADLRRLGAAVVEVGATVEAALDAALSPVAAAQVDAQLALRARFLVPGVTIDVDASVLLVASVGPAALRARLGAELGLVRGRAGEATGALAGSIAADLQAAADTLDGCLLARLGGDLDGLLAALDPEPIAAELDALVAAVVDTTPGLLAAAQAEVLVVERRVRSMVAELNPGAQAQKLLGIFDVLREELDLLNPARLADELGEVHAALRSAIAAYDPAVLATEVDHLVDTAAASLRALDPAALLPDLSGIQTQLERLPDLLPVRAMEGVGTALEEVGRQLTEVDVDGLLATLNGLAPALSDALIGTALPALKAEITALLESIRFASSSASASVSVSVSAGP